MNQSPWRCRCDAVNSWASAFCEMCGLERPALDRPGEKATTSCWTCDACGSRTPGQPVLYLNDGPNESPRGLCSGCHFDLRIKPTVRATPEEVRANVASITAMCDRLSRRMEL